MLTITAPKDTLRYQLSRPLIAARDISGISCKTVSDAMNDFMQADTDSGIAPEKVALKFYMLNHAVAEVRGMRALDEPLGDLQNIMGAYHEQLAPEAMRLFYYLLLICVRESRHTKAPTSTFWDRFKTEYGDVAYGFNESIRGIGSQAAANKFRTDPPDMPLGQFVSSLQFLFYKGKFEGGYGGSAWGKVCDCLVEFVYGRFSAEMMLDTGWTLAHNNGPIFNKGMLYGTYSHTLTMILDVQRAGMIPQLVADASHVGKFLTTQMTDTYKMILDLLGPHVFGGYVDWFLVEALGAVGAYPSQKTTQVAAHGESEKWKMIVAKKEAQAAAAMAAEQAAFFIVAQSGPEKVKVKKIKLER